MRIIGLVLFGIVAPIAGLFSVKPQTANSVEPRKAHAVAAAAAVDGRRIVIIDGDTINVQGERIRILNIDAPESFRSRCEAELKLALRTKERLGELLRSGPVEIQRNGQDRYRRTLATLSVREGDVGRILVQERLALPWKDGREDKERRLRVWCG